MKQSEKSETPATTSDSKSSANSTKTPHHASRYFVVGVLITLFNYALYSIIANLIIRNNDFLWASTIISTLITTLVAYLAHSKITWKERTVTKTAKYKFFIWNLLLAFAIGPWVTQLFSLFTPIYDLAYNICQSLHLNFTYDFVQSTGAYVFTGIVTMILNYLFYDKFVFSESRHDTDIEISLKIKTGSSAKDSQAEKKTKKEQK